MRAAGTARSRLPTRGAALCHDFRMTHSFVYQPDESGYDLREVMEECSALPDLQRVDIVVAWVKRTGLRVVRDSIKAMQDAGAQVRAIIGISQGGTSRQALEESVELFDEAYVFHLPGRTFHPKLYVAYAPDEAAVLVGSHNLTAGGAVTNFEAGVLSRLDLSNEADRMFLQDVTTFVDRLVNDTGVCVPLDEATLSTLVDSGAYLIGDEDGQRDGPGSEPTEDGPGAGEGREPDEDPLFSTSAVDLRKLAVASDGQTSREPAKRKRASGSGATAGSGATSGSRKAKVVRRWYKKLGAIDAQRPERGHPSNTMTLVQAGHELDHKVYFRDEFFGGESWSKTTTARSHKEREVAKVTMEVWIHSKKVGAPTFEIRHTPEYDSGQGNRTTELCWGDFGERLRKRKKALTGLIATLEKYSDGTYRLVIGDSETGPFMK